jgi:predicted signal transduction protein with EAL and GGDEF domain
MAQGERVDFLRRSAPCSIAGHDLYIDGSIGISIHAKAQGRKNFQFLVAEMNLKSVQRHSLESSLRRAIERDEFLSHYQPKVNLVTSEITGVEALIRRQHPDRGRSFVRQISDDGDNSTIVSAIY